MIRVSRCLGFRFPELGRNCSGGVQELSTLYRSLSSLVPNAADLLALDLPELGRVLLVHLMNQTLA